MRGEMQATRAENNTRWNTRGGTPAGKADSLVARLAKPDALQQFVDVLFSKLQNNQTEQIEQLKTALQSASLGAAGSASAGTAAVEDPKEAVAAAKKAAAEKAVLQEALQAAISVLQAINEVRTVAHAPGSQGQAYDPTVLREAVVQSYTLLMLYTKMQAAAKVGSATDKKNTLSEQRWWAPFMRRGEIDVSASAVKITQLEFKSSHRGFSQGREQLRVNLRIAEQAYLMAFNPVKQVTLRGYVVAPASRSAVHPQQEAEEHDKNLTTSILVVK
ncbi:hypothetical protein WJX72_010144 [[Myrmecia] bisecta]|uniref:Uncharacterized protein n=1 Tax=[Myrmecia] bisecta TaxID=41462 RepID=A0AAW1QSM9_9CHLO